MRHTIINVLNFIIFQIGWLIAVYWHNNIAAAFVVLLAIINVKLLINSNFKIFVICIITACIGIVNDYALLNSGLISFPNQQFVVFPTWLAALWLLFISTFSSSMAWMNKLSIIMIGLIGGIAGSISYVIGTKMGAMHYNIVHIPQLIFHFANWCILMPLLFWFYFKLVRLSERRFAK